MAEQIEDKYVVRFPGGMRDRIKSAAKLNGRSMNAEIIATLEAAYPSENPLDVAIEKMNALRKEIDATSDTDLKRKLLRQMLAVANEVSSFLED